MFEGSKHVPGGAFDTWPKARAPTQRLPTVDRTNYYIDGPANALELMLFLESDAWASARHHGAMNAWTASATW